MLNFVSVGLGCLLLFGVATTPANIRPQAKDEIFYQESSIIYDDNEVTSLSSLVEYYTIYYQSRDYNKFDLAIIWPNYTFAPTVGSCAPIAAGNLVGYYDRYDENLIPNHVSGRLVGTGYVYMNEDSAVESVIRELHELMGTMATTGTTEQQFLDGLKSFCTNKGNRVSTYSCMSNNSFSLSQAQSYIRDNIPIVFFLSGYNVGMMLPGDGRDDISYYQSDANHVMVAFGYSTYSYQTTDGNLIKNYFHVAAGLDGYSSGIFDISLNTIINDALAIRID